MAKRKKVREKEWHQQMGRRLKTLREQLMDCSCEISWRVSKADSRLLASGLKAIEKMRCRLDDIAYKDLKDEIPELEIFSLYYGPNTAM